MKINIGIPIDLTTLVRSKLLIQAGSDGGKSYAARKLVEESFGKMQIIIFDPEEEYTSLREKYDFVLIGEGGDLPINPRYAETLAHKLLETGMSAIINLYEMKPKDRIEFVKNFIEAMTYAPKKLWHACMVVMDEFQLFAPEDGKAESTPAMREASSRWRKRGYFFVLMTQRISMVDKTVVGQCHSRMIGFNSLDIDVERAGKELGFKRERWNELKKLEPGVFYAYGPAISREVVQFKVSKVKTKHPKSGETMKTIPPTPEAIKKIISKLENIPLEAEAEIKTKQDLQNKIKELQNELRSAKAQGIGKDKLEEIKKSAIDQANKQIDVKIKAAQAEIEKQYKAKFIEIENENKKVLSEIKNKLSGWKDYSLKIVKFYSNIIMTYKSIFSKIGKMLDDLQGIGIELNIPAPEDIKIPKLKVTIPLIDIKMTGDTTIKDIMKQPIHTIGQIDRGGAINIEGKLAKCSFEILKFLSSVQDRAFTKVQVAVASGYSATSGGFSNSLSELNSKNLIVKEGTKMTLNYGAIDEIKDLLGEAFNEPKNYSIETFKSKLGKCEREIYEVLLSNPDTEYTKEELAQTTETRYSPTSGGFSNSISRLNTLELIARQNGKIKLNPELKEML